MLEIPPALRHSLETGNCVLFVGAGLGYHLTDKDGRRAPTGQVLAEKLAEKFAITLDGIPDLTTIATIVELRKSRAELENFIRDQLAGLEPDERLQWLVGRRWRAIYTTNYDFGLQRAYELIPQPQQKPVTITKTSDLVQFDPKYDVPIYHLHGTLFGPDRSHIVITEDDYAQFREQRRMLFELLKKEFATSTILYLGYSNRDPNWKLLMSEMAAEYQPGTFPTSYRVAPHTDPLEQEILRARQIVTINASFDEFYEVASALVGEVDDIDEVAQLRNQIAPELQTAYDQNPVPVIRLTSSWELVNHAPFSEGPNLRDFLKGNRPNWGLVGTSRYFERDIEEELYLQLLDHATSNLQRPLASVLLSPAGYGVSTLLMAIAARLVIEKAGIVFFLKPGHAIREGDIEFGIRSFTIHG